MAIKQNFKTLYFINGPIPSAFEIDDALNYKGNVLFRNATKIRDGECPEDFDALAGKVPDAYAAIAEEKRLAGGGEPLPEPKADLPGEGSPLTPVKPVVLPAPKPNAGSVWKPNA